MSFSEVVIKVVDDQGMIGYLHAVGERISVLNNQEKACGRSVCCGRWYG